MTGRAPGPASDAVLIRAAVLGDGRLRTVITAAGGGCSWFEDHALTRWRPDPVVESHGWATYIADRDDRSAFRVGSPQDDAVSTSRWRPGGFDVRHAGGGLEASMDVCLAGEPAAELRRVRVTNRGDRARRVQVTAALEIALHHPASDAAHPAFSKLFVQTEFAPGPKALLARRRGREAGARHPWMVLCAPGDGAFDWDTDRAAFVGRGRLADVAPAGIHAATLGGTAGDVLDPMFALRRTATVAPGETATFNFVLGAAADRAQALALAQRWSARGNDVSDAFSDAEQLARRRITQLGLDEPRAELLEAMAVAALKGLPKMRASADVLLRARGSSEALRAHGIDPARMLVAVVANGVGGETRAREAMVLHQYWTGLGIDCQLLIIAENGVRATIEAARDVIVRTPAELGADLDIAMATARVVVRTPLDAWRVCDAADEPSAAPRTGLEANTMTTETRESSANGSADQGAEPLHEHNGIGGFSEGGNEYVIRIPEACDGVAVRPPLPWTNVIANPSFGCLVSESGAGCTWSGNSREHRITPWLNDAVLDPHADALYLRDEENGRVWSPMPGPVPGRGAYEVRHALGATRFLHESEGIATETCMFVARHDPVRFCRVTLTNRSGRSRRISLTTYQQIVLGSGAPSESRNIVTGCDAQTGALIASNRFSGAFACRAAFAHAVAPAAVSKRNTTDREAFLGGSGSVARPAALADAGRLDERTGPGLDPCFALARGFDLDPAETIECTFLLGEASDDSTARAVIARHQTPEQIARALDEATSFWTDIVSRVQIETPEPALDRMVNAWLPYQAISCRLWGRTAFFQSGGAFGFRDQLQDSAIYLMLDPPSMRAQILMHAAHQFVEGDVLHWWHPPLARGIRTRFADDLLWLPFMTAAYLRSTGDASVLSERVAYLEGPPLDDGEQERFIQASVSNHTGDLFEHCCRAIDRSLETGAHGLPLFGCGDWNDGMNRVGEGGRGESVWMAFFLTAVLEAFEALSEQRGDPSRAARYRTQRGRLRAAIDGAAWDGEWYLRAFYDDGSPLGARGDSECQIDGLVQAWAVLTGAADPERARQAMHAVEQRLVSAEDGIIRLLTPPFDVTLRDPGYIKSYVRGVRENGGQYTHAALWIVKAFAALGRRDRAASLLTMLSPVSHTRTPAAVARYGAEPYVVAADVYGAAPHVGRAGWTWYTGSATWMYRVALESILGLEVEGGTHLRIRPCVPDAWPGFRVAWRVPATETVLDIRVRSTGSNACVRSARMDGADVPVETGAALLEIPRGAGTHLIELELGAAPAASAAMQGERAGAAARR